MGKQMQAVELICKKRDGAILTGEEIAWFVEQYTRGEIAEYQASDWLMAVYWRGMNAQETTDLTLSMARSGTQLKVREALAPVLCLSTTGARASRTFNC